MPALSIKEAVDATIAGIKADKVVITIPGYYHYFLTFVRCVFNVWFFMTPFLKT